MRTGNGRIKGDLGERTKQFALNIINLYSVLPRKRIAQILGDQMLRSGTSVGPTCARHKGPNQIQISSVNSKEACRSFRRPSMVRTPKRSEALRAGPVSAPGK